MIAAAASIVILGFFFGFYSKHRTLSIPTAVDAALVAAAYTRASTTPGAASLWC
jgi:hypothetical protein